MKKIIILFSIILACANCAKAEPIAIKIIPAQVISTSYDGIEVGDSMKFKVQDDVYKNNKLYIAKDTIVIGIVDYVTENGWSYDNAQIDIKQFKTKDIKGNVVEIKSPILIDGFEILKFKGKRTAQFFNYCGIVFRGKEIEIIPDKDTIKYNIWIK